MERGLDRKMNNIDNIKKLYLKEKKVLVPREAKEGVEQVELTFRPIPINSPIYSKFGEIGNNPTPDKMLELLQPIIAYSLNIDEKEVTNLDMGMVLELFEVIAEVNNFPKADKTKTANIQGFIKEKQELMSNKELKSNIQNV